VKSEFEKVLFSRQLKAQVMINLVNITITIITTDLTIMTSVHSPVMKHLVVLECYQKIFPIKLGLYYL
jgi:hypothetical protein